MPQMSPLMWLILLMLMLMNIIALMTKNFYFTNNNPNISNSKTKCTHKNWLW